ncbi:STAS domain-containing protein [Pseudoduganella sp. RAF53_2]|uniref:STAS domain-containing protein n=1 Tax=unclassified Pseudoduganella TaxID=2637179 RepID=UPI003F9CA778
MSDSAVAQNKLSLQSLTVANATQALEQGLAALRAGETVFDLSNVTTVDSAAVSVMLAWQRAALQAGTHLELKNLPPSLRSLTQLYGVCNLVAPPSDCGPAVSPAAGPHHH